MSRLECSTWITNQPQPFTRHRLREIITTPTMPCVHGGLCRVSRFLITRPRRAVNTKELREPDRLAASPSAVEPIPSNTVFGDVVIDPTRRFQPGHEFN